MLLLRLNLNLIVNFWLLFLEKFDPVSGYHGHVRRIPSDNIFGVDFKKSLKLSDLSKSELNRWEKRRSELGISNRTSKRLPKI